MKMEMFWPLVAVLAFIGAICITVVVMGIGVLEERERKEHEDSIPYEDNEEYDYGHNVDQHYLDGEGDL